MEGSDLELLLPERADTPDHPALRTPSSAFHRFPGSAALLALRQNPIALREWRLLRRKAVDWRIWLGARWTFDPVVWGAPMVLTYALAPYVLWIVLGSLRGLRLIPAGPLPVDPFLIVALVFAFYVVSICQVLAATAVTAEKEQQTWEQVWLTRLTGRERVAGYYWGRLGPVLACLVITSAFWWLLQPHYAALLRPFWPATISRATLALIAGATVALAMTVGLIGLLASALSTRSLIAVIVSTVGCSHALSLPFTFSPFFLLMSAAAQTSNRFTSASGWLIALLTLAITLACLWWLWLGIASALTRPPVPARLRRSASHPNLRHSEASG